MTISKYNIAFIIAILTMLSIIYSCIMIPQELRGGVYSRLVEYNIIQKLMINAQNEQITSLKKRIIRKEDIYSTMFKQVGDECINRSPNDKRPRNVGGI